MEEIDTPPELDPQPAAELELELELEEMELPNADEEVGPNEEGEQFLAIEPPELFVSHFRNHEAHPAYLRYGVPIFLLGTVILLACAQIGSGVSAEYIIIRDGNIVEQRDLFLVSIFTSIRVLWLNGSYPLALLIAMFSISWPYVNLGLTAYAWFTSYRRPRRLERMVEIIDSLGKWSFVDIIVFVQIMVAFRSTIDLAPTVTLEIVIVPKWGFYGFVVATMMSFQVTHLVLDHHRKVHFRQSIPIEESPEEPIEVSVERKDRAVCNKTSFGLSAYGVVLSIGLYIAGCVVKVYEVENIRGAFSIAVDYSVVSVGLDIPDSQLATNSYKIRFLQLMWFWLCLVMPVCCSLLLGALFSFPFSKIWTERIFAMAEVAFTWSCAEVLLVSTTIAVLQIPTFGDGLVEADCSQCFIVDAQLFSSFALLCIAGVFNTAVNIWLYRKAHGIIYGD